MNAVWLMFSAALAHLAPEHIASAMEHSQAAWESALYGLEAALLWLALGASVAVIPVQAVAAYGAMEGAQRAACRLAFPMDRPPPKLNPGENLCDRASGMPASWASLMAASLVVMQIAGSRRA